MADLLSLATSVVTLLVLANFSVNRIAIYTQSYSKAGEEMLSLVNEAQNTRHALEPIDTYAIGGNVSETEKRLVLSCTARLWELEGRLSIEVLSQLRGRVENIHGSKISPRCLRMFVGAQLLVSCNLGLQKKPTS